MMWLEENETAEAIARTGEYTKIGTYDATDEFVTAVEENPLLEGWGNKIVQIARR